MKPIIEPEYQEAWNWMQKNNRELIRELKKEVDPYWAYERRKEYLETLMVPLVLQTIHSIALQELNIESGNLTGSVWFGEQAQKCVKQLVKYQNELYYTRPGMNNGNSITQDMVVRARQYPYRDLIELKRNMAPCPFHADKDPSFSVKNNYGHCFGCGWKGDTIAFYMEKMDVTFPVAVKALQ
jgi:hypothetical protein